MDRHESLLQSIKALYSKINLMLFHNTFSHYRPTTGSDQNLRQQLQALINAQTQQSAQSSSPPIVKNEPADVTQSPASTQTPVNHQTTTQAAPDKDAVYEHSLASDLKSRALHDQQSPITTQLKSRIWDHVHSAHRLARSGEKESALFHINLATDALKTIEHYMPAEEYDSFVAEVIKQLQP